METARNSKIGRQKTPGRNISEIVRALRKQSLSNMTFTEAGDLEKKAAS